MKYRRFFSRSWMGLVHGLLRPLEAIIVIIWMKRTLRRPSHTNYNTGEVCYCKGGGTES